MSYHFKYQVKTESAIAKTTSLNPLAGRLRTTCAAMLLGVLTLCLSAPRASAADPYAKAVVFARILNGNVGNSYTSVANALGAPDANYLSLGGPGASIILDMGADTPVVDGPGLDLEVREIGAAFGGTDESYRVLVSNSTDTNTFVFVGVGRALSLIDIHPSGLASARYVWLQDIATETLNSTSPGSDIDSLRTLYYSGGGDVAPPSNVQVRLIGQGAWVSWTPSTATNVTSYAIRRSLDGVAFGSSADFTVSAQETALYDPSLLAVSNYFYAVCALVGSMESTLVVADVPGSSLNLSLLTNQTVHLGDDTIAYWVDPSPQHDLTLTFSLPTLAEGPEAELALEVFDVSYSGNAILVNGAKVASLPTQTATESWGAKTQRLPAGALQPGLNTLVLSARNSSGGITGSLDDFQVRNVWLRLLSQTNLNLITSTRFTQIAAGQTNVTLRWVVDQTPSLAPVNWQTVSSPIEWTGTLTPTNGFFRLRDTP
jgi:hypothetical protein